MIPSCYCIRMHLFKISYVGPSLADHIHKGRYAVDGAIPVYVSVIASSKVVRDCPLFESGSSKANKSWYRYGRAEPVRGAGQHCWYKQKLVYLDNPGHPSSPHRASFYYCLLLGQNMMMQTPAKATSPPTTSPLSGRSPSNHHPAKNDSTIKNPP